MHPNAIIPQYAKPGDGGVDLTAIELTVKEDGRIVYDTGLSFEIPEGYVGLLFPRSSVSKTDLVMANSVGVIDSGYRGSVMAVFKILDHDPKRYSPGDRVCQLMIVPHPVINFEDVGDEELTTSVRGEGGFGSTGN